MGMIPRMIVKPNDTSDDYFENNSVLNNRKIRRRWNKYASLSNESEYPFIEALNSSNFTNFQLGGDKDKHGCTPSAGFIWCDQLHTCIQPWVIICPSASIP